MASDRPAPGTPRRASIRAYLLWLVVVLALPLTALEAWSLYTAAQADARRAREHVLQLAQFTASETARFLGQTRNILNGFAARRAFPTLSPRPSMAGSCAARRRSRGPPGWIPKCSSSDCADPIS